MMWLEKSESKLGGKEAGGKAFGSLVEAIEYSRKHIGCDAGTGVLPNPFEARQPAVSAEMEKR